MRDVDVISREYVEKELKIHNIPGMAIGVIKDDKIILSEGYGVADVENKSKIDSDSLFGIASCTKSFTAALIAMLVDQGKLDFDTPIREYLPDFRMYDEYATRECTIRDMLNHRTGIPGHDSLYTDEIDRAELFKRIRYIEPNAPLRTVTQYNNVIYTLAGHIAERVSGLKWDDMIRDWIFKPLGMNNSNTSISELRKSNNIAEPHWRQEDGSIKKIKNWSVSPGEPCAAINSCITDMMKWIQFHLNMGEWNGKQLISKECMEEMHKWAVPFQMWSVQIDEIPPMQGYSMGWIEDYYRGNDLVYHVGEIEGYCSLMCFLPKKNIGVMIMINNHNSAILIEQSILYTILDNVLDLEKEIFTVNGHFDHDNIFVDAIVPLLNEDGHRFNGRVLEITDDVVKMDLNHPLAGKTLNFKGSIVEAREATKEEIQEMINRISGDDSCSGGCCGGGCGHHDHDHEHSCGCGH